MLVLHMTQNFNNALHINIQWDLDDKAYKHTMYTAH